MKSGGASEARRSFRVSTAGSPVRPPAAESPLLFVYSHQKGEGFDVTAQKPLNVLVTSEGWQPALACIQSFGRRGHRVFLLCLDEPSLHATSRFVAGVARYPRRPTLDGLAEAVFKLAESNGIDLVVPISDDDALIAARINELFPPGSGGAWTTLSPTIRAIPGNWPSRSSGYSRGDPPAKSA